MNTGHWQGQGNLPRELLAAYGKVPDQVRRAVGSFRGDTGQANHSALPLTVSDNLNTGVRGLSRKSGCADVVRAGHEDTAGRHRGNKTIEGLEDPLVGAVEVQVVGLSVGNNRNLRAVAHKRAVGFIGFSHAPRWALVL